MLIFVSSLTGDTTYTAVDLRTGSANALWFVNSSGLFMNDDDLVFTALEEDTSGFYSKAKTKPRILCWDASNAKVIWHATHSSDETSVTKTATIAPNTGSTDWPIFVAGMTDADLGDGFT